MWPSLPHTALSPSPLRFHLQCHPSQIKAILQGLCLPHSYGSTVNAGTQQQKMGVAEMGKAGMGHSFLDQNTPCVSLCSISLDHHHPRVWQQQHKATLRQSQVAWQPPEGILSQIQVWGGRRKGRKGM